MTSDDELENSQFEIEIIQLHKQGKPLEEKDEAAQNQLRDSIPDPFAEGAREAAQEIDFIRRGIESAADEAPPEPSPSTMVMIPESDGLVIWLVTCIVAFLSILFIVAIACHR